MSDVLHTFAERLEVIDRNRMVGEPGWQPAHAVPVVRFDGSTIALEALDALMDDFDSRRRLGRWTTPADSDSWLAPRLHWALRLTRSESADRSMWEWVATRFAWYVMWRWSGQMVVPESRWHGPVNKQAFARLWWGAELFRDGVDYRPTERLFRLQDFPNSYLQRTVVRCRPFALALVDQLVPAEAEREATADEVNDLARAVNIALAGEPLEAALGYPADDSSAYLDWVLAGPEGDVDWEALPAAVDDSGATDGAAAAARELVRRCASYAPLTAKARTSRSHRRRLAKAWATSDSTTPG